MTIIPTAAPWARVCHVDEIPAGSMYALDDPALPPIVVFNVDGQLHATSNLCTHNIAMLSDGTFDGRTVECPLHGGAFDVVTGEAVAYPCEIALQRFTIRIEAGDVFVQPQAQDLG